MLSKKRLKELATEMIALEEQIQSSDNSIEVRLAQERIDNISKSLTVMDMLQLDEIIMNLLDK